MQKNIFINLIIFCSFLFSQASDSQFNFIGIEPVENKVPYFDFKITNELDTLNFKYYAQLETSIPYFDLTFRDTLINKKKTEYRTIIKITQNSEIIFHQFYDYLSMLPNIDKNTISLKSIKNYNLSILKAGNYDIEIIFIDLFSKKYYKQNYGFKVKEVTTDILISDIKVTSKYNSEKTIQYKNKLEYYRNDTVIIKFDYFAKNLKNQPTLFIEYEKRITYSKKFLNFFGDIISLIPNLVSDLVYDVLGIEEKIYIDFNAIQLKNRYGIHILKIPMMKYDSISFSDKLIVENEIDVKIELFKYFTDVELNDLKNSINIKKIDTLESNFDFNKNTFTNDVQTLTPRLIDVHHDYFSFQNLFYPSKDNEVQHYFDQTKYLLSKKQINYFNTLTELNEIQQFYIQLWSKMDTVLPYKYNCLSYFRRINFAKDNFSTLFIDIHGSNYLKFDVFLDGWATDKGRIYLKYGLADDMSGDNFIDLNSQVLPLEYLPKQKWFYKNGKIFEFEGNKFATDKFYLE